ncbi:Glycosyltransferase [Treponema sp. JC4]|uniref:glycosyltransferase family 4 protein n=1 Tax=Treponema sp. JC4 TaxID=1124982 RepID=UPI00025B0CB6|nr:glycosyltransferase family 4 protein [Treponema sp. JC4]EID84152.1 Glycosyltransferase [Treponema sp. JC4]
MSKILLISNKDNNFYNFRSELILKLVELKYEVVLMCPYGKKIDFFTERGCQFIDVDVDRRGTSILTDLKLLKTYRRLIKAEKPDVVLLYTTKCCVYGGMACRNLGIPYIVNNAGLIESENPNSPLQILLRQLYRIGFGKAACLMFQNTRERDYINGLLNNKVHYRDIPGSGVNLREFSYRKYPASDAKVTFNYVARIVSIKGIKEFLDCAEIIKKEYPNANFVIYGDYDEEEYRPRIEKLIKEGVIEYGGVAMDMKPHIEAAHAAIHPSYYEGMTNVVLEHSAMGRPCIGSDISGVREGIDDGKTGFLFEVKNVESMVNAVRKFLKLSHAEKEEMGKAARAKMENQFSRDIVTNIYIEEIEKALMGESK